MSTPATLLAVAFGDAGLCGRYRTPENGYRNAARPYTVPVYPHSVEVAWVGARLCGAAYAHVGKLTGSPAGQHVHAQAGGLRGTESSLEPRGCWGKPGQLAGPDGARTRWQGNTISQRVLF